MPMDVSQENRLQEKISKGFSMVKTKLKQLKKMKTCCK